jgi:hypothetical protein
MAFVAHTQPPEGSQPSQQEPNLLPLLSTLLSLRPSRIPTVRGSPLSPPFRQTLVQPVAVTGPVSHHPLRSVWRETAVPVASTAVPSCGRARVTGTSAIGHGHKPRIFVPPIPLFSDDRGSSDAAALFPMQLPLSRPWPALARSRPSPPSSSIAGNVHGTSDRGGSRFGTPFQRASRGRP